MAGAKAETRLTLGVEPSVRQRRAKFGIRTEHRSTFPEQHHDCPTAEASRGRIGRSLHRPTRRPPHASVRDIPYLAGGVNGALMVVKYWMAAPMATGAVTRICPARVPSAPTARMPPRQPTAAAGMKGPKRPMMVAEATVAPTMPPSRQPTAPGDRPVDGLVHRQLRGERGGAAGNRCGDGEFEVVDAQLQRRARDDGAVGSFDLQCVVLDNQGPGVDLDDRGGVGRAGREADRVGGLRRGGSRDDGQRGDGHGSRPASDDTTAELRSRRESTLFAPTGSRRTSPGTTCASRTRAAPGSPP
ncbi:hypothetical protein APR12_005889 [Nocardia amikacinitolerans]|nr:hypothetical protein [Nocardia amikacinitolerans]